MRSSACTVAMLLSRFSPSHNSAGLRENFGHDASWLIALQPRLADPSGVRDARSRELLSQNGSNTVSATGAWLARSPASYRRAWLVSTADGAFWSLVLRRTLNAAPARRDQWFSTLPGTEPLVDPIDPEMLGARREPLRPGCRSQRVLRRRVRPGWRGRRVIGAGICGAQWHRMRCTS